MFLCGWETRKATGKRNIEHKRRGEKAVSSTQSTESLQGSLHFLHLFLRVNSTGNHKCFEMGLALRTMFCISSLERIKLRNQQLQSCYNQYFHMRGLVGMNNLFSFPVSNNVVKAHGVLSKACFSVALTCQFMFPAQQTFWIIHFWISE